MRERYIIDSQFKIESINTIWIRDYEGDYHFKGERHPSWEMLYIESGTLTVAEDENIYELGAGQAIFHAPMEFHRFWVKNTQPKTKFKVVSFVLDTNIKHNLADGIFTFTYELQRQFKNVFFKIEESYDTTNRVRKKENNNPADEVLALKMLETFLLNVISQTSPEKAVPFTQRRLRYKEAVEYMNTHVTEWLSLNDIAKGTNISQSYLKQMFSEYTGCGVIHYFIKLKINYAISLLKEGMSIMEVSEKLSFSSPNYFSTVFKREMKMTPREYISM